MGSTGEAAMMLRYYDIYNIYIYTLVKGLSNSKPTVKAAAAAAAASDDSDGINWGSGDDASVL